MNSRIAFPFLTLSEASVSTTPWSISLNGGDWNDCGEYLAAWDSSSTIALKRSIEIDRNAAADEVGIEETELSLSLDIRIGTGPGRIPQLVVHRESRNVEPSEPTIVVDQLVPGERLSAVLDIVVEITLGAPPAGSGELSPKRAGDRLWQDRRRIRIEGEEPRLPIEAIDLQSILREGTAASAPWYLHWSPGDWTRDFHGAIRLYINSNLERTVKRIEKEDPETLQVLMADVMSQICERFIHEQEPGDWMETQEPGSLGAQAWRWLKHAWPGRDFGYMKSELRHRPGNFRAALLALAEPGID